MEVTTRLLTLLMTVIYVNCQQIVEKGQTKFLRPGESFKMPCTVTGHNAGQHMVYWKKSQDLPEVPSPDRNYYDVSHNFIITGEYAKPANAPHYKMNYQSATSNFELSLNTVRPEENGIYSCQVHNALGVVLSRVDYNMNVIDPANELLLWGERDSQSVTDSAINVTSQRNDNSLTFSSKTTGFIMCTVRGAMPVPIVQLTINGRRLEGLTKFGYHQTSGPLGMQKQSMSIGRYVKGISVTGADDGKMAVCESWIEDSNGQAMSPVKRKQVPLSILFEAEFLMQECKQDLQTALGVENYEMSCKFRSKPNPLKTWFTAESTRNTIETNNMKVMNFNALVQNVGNYEFVATLKISVVESNHFQAYKLQVQNEMGTTSITLTLRQGADTRLNGASEVRGVGLVLLLSALFALILA